MENLQSELCSLESGFSSLQKEISEHQFNFLNLDTKDNFIKTVSTFCAMHNNEINELNKKLTNMKNQVLIMLLKLQGSQYI